MCTAYFTWTIDTIAADLASLTVRQIRSRIRGMRGLKCRGLWSLRKADLVNVLARAYKAIARQDASLLDGRCEMSAAYLFCHREVALGNMEASQI